MTQQSLVNRLATTFISPEATFGLGGGAVSQIWPKSGSFDDSRDQEEVTVDDESPYFFDEKTALLGLKSGGCKFSTNVVPAGGLLNAAASPATPPHSIALKAMLGGEQANAGSLVATGTSPTQVTVTAGQGSRLPAGTLCLVEVAGTLYPTFVATQSTDTLTFGIALPGTPGTGALVINAYQYYPTDANSSSLEVRRALVGDANEQYQYLGCNGNFELNLERGKLITETYNLTCADWNEGALGYSTAFAANSQGSGFVLKNAVTLLQTPATTTRTNLPFTSLALKFSTAMALQEEHGGINGWSAWQRTGMERVACEVTLRTRIDRQLVTWWNARTQLRLFHATMAGSGLTARAHMVHLPLLTPRGAPKIVDVGGRRLHEFRAVTQIDGTLATALQRAPYVLGRA